MLTEDRSEARMLAQELDRFNTERREEQERVLVQARELAAARPESERVLVVMGEEWHEGVIGIVAGRLKDDSYRPALVATLLDDGSAKGSARSVPGFHLGEALDAAADLMIGHGGHELAAGFRIDPLRIDELRAHLNRIADALPEDIFRPRIAIDAVIAPEELDPSQARELELLEPFGAANAEPLFLLEDARIAESTPLGKDGQHLRATLEAGGIHAPAVAFGFAEQLSRPGARWDLALRLEVNRWNGREECRWSVAQARLRA
jgi:single-stranded-DNA-specific exonuclease